MMEKYFLKTAGLTALVLSLHFAGIAQREEDHDSASHFFEHNEEIVIKPKINIDIKDKDIKLELEIKDGQVFVNGQPVEVYRDTNVSIRKKKIMVMDGQNFSFGGPDALMGPDGPVGSRSIFRNGGDWNLDGEAANRAFLGVRSIKPEGKEEGATVREITKGSAADKAGLQAGDRITKIDETAISDPQDLSNAIQGYKPDDKITVTYTRDGKEQKTAVTLGKSKGNNAYNDNYGLTLPRSEDFNFTIPPMPGIDMSPAFSWNDGSPKLGIRARDMEDGKGVKVLHVDSGSPADKAGVREGDIITDFDGKEVDSATALADLARESRTKESIKIDLTHDGKSREVELKIPKKLKTADL